MIRCGELIQALCNLMREPLNQYPIQQMDETTVPVLKEDGRAAPRSSYWWVQRGGPPAQPVILFSYSPSRRQAVADQLPQDFQGALQSDGNAGYPAVCAKNSLRHAACAAQI
jgi:transposase